MKQSNESLKKWRREIRSFANDNEDDSLSRKRRNPKQEAVKLQRKIVQYSLENYGIHYGNCQEETMPTREVEKIIEKQKEAEEERSKSNVVTESAGDCSIQDRLNGILENASFTASPKKDQHFLISDVALEKIISTANLSSGDVVLEIGPGPGHVTQELLKHAGQIYAIELDTKFKDVLYDLERQNPNFKIIFGSAVAPSTSWPRDANKIVSNLPYSILEPFLQRLVREKNFTEITLITGKKYYQRLTSGISFATKTAIITQAFFDIELVHELSKSDFDPEPREESVIIKLTRANARSRDIGIRQFATKMIYSPEMSVESLLRDVIAEETSQRMKRNNLEDLPRMESCDVSKEILGRRIDSLDNSQIEKVARALRKICNKHSKQTSLLDDEFEDE